MMLITYLKWYNVECACLRMRKANPLELIRDFLIRHLIERHACLSFYDVNQLIVFLVYYMHNLVPNNSSFIIEKNIVIMKQLNLANWYPHVPACVWYKNKLEREREKGIDGWITEDESKSEKIRNRRSTVRLSNGM